MNDLPTKCLPCDDGAVAVFYFSQGCMCSFTTVQPLCWCHAFKSEPANGGSKELIKDLSVGGSFTKTFDKLCRFPYA